MVLHYCPFCGAKPKDVGPVFEGQPHQKTDDRLWVVVCKLCGCHGPSAETEYSAEVLWNNRTIN